MQYNKTKSTWNQIKKFHTWQARCLYCKNYHQEMWIWDYKVKYQLHTRWLLASVNLKVDWQKKCKTFGKTLSCTARSNRRTGNPWRHGSLPLTLSSYRFSVKSRRRWYPDFWMQCLSRLRHLAVGAHVF